jgi:hypothetical protein
LNLHTKYLMYYGIGLSRYYHHKRERRKLDIQ